MIGNKFRPVLLGAVGAVVLSVSVWAATQTRGTPTSAIGFSGIEAPWSLAQLTREADLVVIGIAGATQVRPFTSNPLVPTEERDPRIYGNGSYNDLTFGVLEYIKGSGPPNISVRRWASTPNMRVILDEAPILVTGGQYVLFLQKGESVWTGGYIVIGSRGVGKLSGSKANFSAFGDIDLAELRRTGLENQQAPSRR